MDACLGKAKNTLGFYRLIEQQKNNQVFKFISKKIIIKQNLKQFANWYINK